MRSITNFLSLNFVVLKQSIEYLAMQPTEKIFGCCGSNSVLITADQDVVVGAFYLQSEDASSNLMRSHIKYYFQLFAVAHCINSNVESEIGN